MSPVALIILFIAGIAAVIVEMLIPGMIVGICGAICMVTSIVLAYNRDYTLLGHVLSGCTFFSIPILAVIWYKIFSKTLAMHESEEGFTSANEKLNDLIYKEGVTLTPLHPSGIVIIDGERVDVVTNGTMIEKDVKVKVVEVGGNRVVVTSVKE